VPDGEAFSLEILDGAAAVAREEWDACAGTDNPFVSHAFFQALEASGSAVPKTGWAPHHLALKDPRGRLAGLVPVYLKSHSYGEYVFDWSWAEAYQRAGANYYPKLQVAVPFTPVTGPRLFVRDASQPARAALIQALLRLADQSAVETMHITFPHETEWKALGEAGFLLRQGRQYHWENRGYRDFQDFLDSLASRKRKAIRKERIAAAAGLEIRVRTGAEITSKHWDAFYQFYRNTTDGKWGGAYLTRRFFDLAGKVLADRIALITAERDGKPIAAALNFIGADTLYGRNWGACEHVPFLHFELCYYQAIEYAIAHGLKRVEAGAQGEHKIQRGYLPQPTYSAHWIRNPGFRKAVAEFLAREKRAIERESEELEELSPFRNEIEQARQPRREP
jgi:uncharacterized protein